MRKDVIEFGDQVVCVVDQTCCEEGVEKELFGHNEGNVRPGCHCSMEISDNGVRRVQVEVVGKIRHFDPAKLHDVAMQLTWVALNHCRIAVQTVCNLQSPLSVVCSRIPKERRAALALTSATLSNSAVFFSQRRSSSNSESLKRGSFCG